MPKKPDNHSPEYNDLLNKLIRRSRKESDEEFSRPDAATITSYLSGTASEEQNKIMQAALARSSAFRREILEAASDIDELGAAGPHSKTKTASTISTPGRKEFLAEYGEIDRPKHTRESWWSKLIRWRIPQLYLPVAAAAVLAWLIFVPRDDLLPTKANLEKVYHVEDPAELITNRTRDPSGTATTFDTSREAAMDEFRLMLDYQNGRFEFKPPKSPGEPISPFEMVSLYFLDDSGSKIFDYQASVPKETPITDRQLEAWVLVFPSRILYRAEMSSTEVNIDWPRDIGQQGCVAFIYSIADGFKATRGMIFTLE